MLKTLYNSELIRRPPTPEIPSVLAKRVREISKLNQIFYVIVSKHNCEASGKYSELNNKLRM